MESLWNAITWALGDIASAFFKLAPFAIAFIIYTSLLEKGDVKTITPWQRSRRVALHAFVALCVLAFYVYGLGGTCSKDEEGYCNDPDWRPLTRQENLDFMLRLTIVTFAGMVTALHRYLKAK